MQIEKEDCPDCGQLIVITPENTFARHRWHPDRSTTPMTLGPWCEMSGQDAGDPEGD
jgi:hypothetical protein